MKRKWKVKYVWVRALCLLQIHHIYFKNNYVTFPYFSQSSTCQKKICIVIDILFCLTVSLQKTKPEIHADRAETSKMQFLPGKAALLIIPVREASSWRDPTLTSWHLRIAWIVSEWEIRNCKTCTTRKKRANMNDSKFNGEQRGSSAFEKFKKTSCTSEDGI